MKVSPIYTYTHRELLAGSRRIIHQGGSHSGKTVNILGALATLCNDEEGEPSVTTITSQTMPHLKGGALRDFEDYIYPEFRGVVGSYHKTDHLFTFKSGHKMEFKVFPNAGAAHGPKRKRLFVNEANSFDFMTYFQLDSRSDQTIIDYNPSIRFWSHTELIGRPGNKLFISDHRHNPFLHANKHAEIEGYTNREIWNVYARGLTGNVMGIIFPNWEMIPDEDFPSDSDCIFGIDFGYTNDPTAIVKIARVGNMLFVKELAYITGLAPTEIKIILTAEGCTEGTTIFCEHDPDMIRILRNHKISAYPARKGQGSVNAGIELLKSFNVKYTGSSKNLHRELQTYIWIPEKNDPTRFTNEPVDCNNHLLDAIRYPVYTKYLKKTI